MTTIQTAVSRKDTLRVQIANSIWQHGSGAFFEEDIPFSARNNHIFAKKLVTMYHKLTDGLPDPSFLVVELGAGLGLLGHFFLTLLQDSHPGLYAKTIFWSTDATHLPMFRGLDTHKNCKRKHLDMHDPDFEGQKPIFCFANYLLDAIPPLCAKVHHKELQEIVFQTEAPSDLVLWDASVTPPREFTLETLIGNPPHTWQHHLLPQIANAIEEQAQIQTWDTQKLPKADQHHLETFVQHTELSGYFNVIPGLTEHLEKMISQLHPQGSYLLSDFGFAESLSDEQGTLASRYQLALFHSVCFPFIRHITNAMGAKTCTTTRALDQTQECLISLEHKEILFEPIFQTPFPDDGLSQKLDALLEKEDKEFLSLYPTFKNTLSSEESSDYVLCKLLASRLFRMGQLKEVLHWAGHMEHLFDDLAPDAYLLTGWACQLQKDHDTAIACFQEVIKTCPHHSLAYGASAASALALGDFEHAERWITLALTWARGDIYWIQMVTLCTLLYRKQDLEKLKTILVWIKQILETSPEKIPPRVKTQLSELVPLIRK